MSQCRILVRLWRARLIQAAFNGAVMLYCREHIPGQPADGAAFCCGLPVLPGWGSPVQEEGAGELCTAKKDQGQTCSRPKVGQGGGFWCGSLSHLPPHFDPRLRNDQYLAYRCASRLSHQCTCCHAAIFSVNNLQEGSAVFGCA